jgi:hypothetical protein
MPLWENLSMTTQVQNFLSNFKALPLEDQRELAAEILRRSVKLETVPLSDDHLTVLADELFLKLDREETRSANHPIPNCPSC